MAHVFLGARDAILVSVGCAEFRVRDFQLRSSHDGVCNGGNLRHARELSGFFGVALRAIPLRVQGPR